MTRFGTAAIFLLAAAIGCDARYNFAQKEIQKAQKNRAQRNLHASLIANSRRLSEDEEEEQAQFSFDVTGYSLKYSRCQMVEQYNDEAAAGGEDGQSSPMVKKRFAVLRLCPTSSCDASKQVGCASGYGQYMVEMDTYLQAMQQYREDLKEGYCNYCEDYMQAVYEAVENGEDEVDEDDMDRVRRKRRLEGEDEGEDEDEMEDEEEGEDEDEMDEEEDREEEENEEEDEEEEDMEEEEDEEVEEDEDEEVEENAAVDYSTFDYYSACVNYQNDCAEEEADGYYEPINVEEYFECGELDYEDNYGNKLYVGVRCANDAFSLKLGVFSDEFCTEYVGHQYNIDTVSGLSLSTADMSVYYTEECISCQESSNPYRNVEEDQEDDDDIAEICVNIYNDAAKCEANMFTSNSYGDSDDTSCTFIQNVLKGSYNEKGQIYLDLQEYYSQAGYHEEQDSEVTGTQTFFLVVFIVGSVALLGYATMLHNKITKSGKNSGTEGLYAKEGGETA